MLLVGGLYSFASGIDDGDDSDAVLACLGRTGVLGAASELFGIKLIVGARRSTVMTVSKSRSDIFLDARNLSLPSQMEYLPIRWFSDMELVPISVCLIGDFLAFG